MYDRLAQLIKLIETFLVKAPPLWVGVGLIVAGIIGFEGMVTYNQASMFCMKCHEPDGIYRSFEEDHVSHVPYKRDDVHCLACHTDKDFYVFASNLVDHAQDGFAKMTSAELTHLPAQDPGYTDTDCLTCHYDVLKLDEAEKLELPERVAQIGLRFSHKRHFWVKDYPAEAAERLGKLSAASVLSEQEKQELEFLLRARLGRCSQCHNRLQPLEGGEQEIDRTINYFSINPMRCIGCHTDAVRGVHPGTVHLNLPSEETCRRCHTGTFHGRFTIFRAECEGRDQRDCQRCHPGWQPFVQVIPVVPTTADAP